VFFAHSRIGKGNRPFRLWKFRTMVKDADTVLERYLREHPDLQAEWVETHKLKNDPRVTRVGRLLRRSSLDELPQLLSVLSGEMSMVGPRPIVADEISKYGPLFELYLQVRPGLTGLWQSSGRTDTSYRTRLALDLRYMQERTLWMDLKVLLKTIRVVVLGHGAY
jgi:lipopolysaccharide/colanic/teichoic acid biosynthesis glycosyltransferase